MNPRDFDRVAEEAERAVIGGARSIAILGLTPIALSLVQRLRAFYLSGIGVAVYDDAGESTPPLSVPVRPFAELRATKPDLIVVASDDDKERLLDAAFTHVTGAPRVVLGGYGHLRFRDAVFHETLRGLLVPSLANGYPNTLVHLYQCLVNAARLDLAGVVAEFGMFRGGTTMFLAQIVAKLGKTWPVIGFDTFAGFPPRRSMLDMYDHPDCAWHDVDAVRRYLQGERVEIVVGDLVETCKRLATEDVVLSFVDTDNHTSASAVLDVVRDRTVLGGAIVLDHFTGTDRFCYTLGERMAARVLLTDSRYFHLHDTGVFYRQR